MDRGLKERLIGVDELREVGAPVPKMSVICKSLEGNESINSQDHDACTSPIYDDQPRHVKGGVITAGAWEEDRDEGGDKFHPGDCLIPSPRQTSSGQTPGGVKRSNCFGICGCRQVEQKGSE